MAWLPDGEKILKICVFILTQLTNVTDGRRDRRTPHADIGRAYASHRVAKMVILRAQFYQKFHTHTRLRRWWTGPHDGCAYANKQYCANFLPRNSALTIAASIFGNRSSKLDLTTSHMFAFLNQNATTYPQIIKFT